MKKTIILVSFLAIAAFIGFTEAAPRGEPFVTKTYLNEGDNRAGLAVAVSSTAWTQILPADVTRRAALLHTLSTAGETVCLSTFTTSTILCAATTKGVHLEAGGVIRDNSEQILNARVTDASASTVYIYGLIYKDNKDSGDSSN